MTDTDTDRDELAEAQAEVDRLAGMTERIRARVAAGTDGASTLHAAEYRLHLARRHLDALTSDHEQEDA